MLLPKKAVPGTARDVANANKKKQHHALEDYIKDWYSTSAFNECKISGQDRRTCHEDFHKAGCHTSVHSYACHGPLELQERGVGRHRCRRGQGHLGESAPHYSRLLVLKNGTSRRTIDLSALSKAGVREIHHTRSAAKMARTVLVIR